jgi:AcrR family transcriptional regulator
LRTRSRVDDTNSPRERASKAIGVLGYSSGSHNHRIRIMTRRARAAATGQLSREDWVRGAIEFLATNSVDALRVDVLANRLGVTKGSFYWHFESRDELLHAVVELWRQYMVTDIQAWLRTNAGTPLSRLKRLLRTAISPRVDVPGGPLELTLRDWARRDRRVDEVVRQVDAERIAILTGLYRDLGLPQREAESHAFAYMSYLVGGRSMLFSADQREIERRLRIAEQFFIPKTS